MSAGGVALAARVREACRAMDFARVGIARARASDHGDHLRAWLSAGYHGDMAFMTELLDQRLDITRLLPGARSVVMVADQYADRAVTDPDVAEDSASPAHDNAAQGPRSTAVVARYARGKDYHHVIKRRLHMLADRLREIEPSAEFRCFVDTAPVLEREQAERAFGERDGRRPPFLGKHTLLIDPALGSWLLLGGIATTLTLFDDPSPATQPAATMTPTDHCGTCTRCIDACPTNAITPHHIEATRCVSYLTLEHRGLIEPDLHSGIGNRLLGCDICQEVCPFNAPLEHAGTGPSRVHPAYRDPLPSRERLAIIDVLRWTDDDRRQHLAGSAGKRASLEMLKRTALINAGNAIRNGALDAIDLALEIRAAADRGTEDTMIRRTALQVLDQLRDQPERVTPSNP
jgi:epoxyqueuosine reductase